MTLTVEESAFACRSYVAFYGDLLGTSELVPSRSCFSRTRADNRELHEESPFAGRSYVAVCQDLLYAARLKPCPDTNPSFARPLAGEGARPTWPHSNDYRPATSDSGFWNRPQASR
jgi:hypothetical protein